MAFLGQEEELREFQDRFRFVYTALFIGLGILVSRLIFLQILNGDKMRRYSEDNRIKRVKIAAPRGMIFDRNRVLVIDNRPSFDVEVTPQYLNESGHKKEIVEKMATILQTPIEEIEEKLQAGRTQPKFMPIKVRTDLPRDQIAQLETWRLDMPGVSTEMEIQRTNVFGDVASHLLGYIGAVTQTELPTLQKAGKNYSMGDSLGKAGIEKQLEETLRGIDGQDVVEVDAVGRRIRDKERGRVLSRGPDEAATPAIPGKNVVLTIDQDLQMAAVKAFGEKSGGLVALDPRNGEVLAMVSRPSFDPTEFSRGVSATLWKKLLEDENRPLRDKTLQDHYPPGSTFKVITAIAGLESGVVDENTKFRCTGSMRVGNRVIHCHKKEGHGEVDVVSAITQSCDVYFYRVAQKLASVDDIAKWAFKFGLGAPSGVELPREVSGLVPTEAWKMKRFNQPWNGGETLSVAIGQSYLLTTALQMANVYAAIANGGTLFKPHYIKSVETVDGQVLSEGKSEVIRKIEMNPKHLELVRQGVWGVINSPRGTAHSQHIPGMEFSGKTGTVQVIHIAKEKIYQKCINLKYRQRHHGWFVGYAPSTNPSIVVAVIGEHACSGSQGAAPIARQVIKTYLEKNYPDLYSEKAVKSRAGSAAVRYIPEARPATAEDEEVVPDLPDAPGGTADETGPGEESTR